MICEKKTSKYPNGRTGTFAGYKAHLNRKEEVCAECLSAGKEYENLRKKRRKEKDLERWKELQRAGYQRNAEKRRAEAKERYWANREEALAENKRYREENREALAEKRRQRGEESKERSREYSRKWSRENKERVKEYRKTYLQENKEKYREWNRSRSARKRTLPTEKYSEKDITRLYGNVCYLCAELVDLDTETPGEKKNVEHLIPLSHPSCPGDILSNVRWSHEKCNFRKYTRTPEEAAPLFPNMIDPYKKEELWHAVEKLSPEA